MKIKRYGVLFFVFAKMALGDIQEIPSLERFSNRILEEENGKQEKNISKKTLEKKSEEKVETITEQSKKPSLAVLSKELSSAYVDISEKERKDDIFYKKGENKPFTGVFALFIGDWIQYIETYQNGILEGESSWFTEDGKRILYENYSKGELDGKQLSYYQNGKPKAEIYYKKGKIVGVICFSKNGEILHQSIFKNGTGIWKLYWENGNLLETGKYVEFKKDGLWKRYHEDGSIESTLEYKNGRLIRETWG